MKSLVAAQLLHKVPSGASLTRKRPDFAREFGADGQIRTGDRRFTKPLLYH